MAQILNSNQKRGPDWLDLEPSFPKVNKKEIRKQEKLDKKYSNILEFKRPNLAKYDVRTLTKPQRNIFYCTKRFRIVVAGRRFGKTVLGINEALHEAQSGKNRLIWYVAPTYAMAKDLAWEELKDAIPPHMILRKNEQELSITLKGYRSKIVLKGADKPDSLRGKGLDFLIMDEAADIKAETWFKVLYPALTDKKGRALFIGTPKGFNWFYDLYAYAESKPEWWGCFTYTTAEGGNVDDEELEYAKATLSPKQFEQEFMASFETLSNRIYQYFSRKRNVDIGVEDYGQEIYVGMDFNVSPMSAVLGQKVGNQLHIFDEVEIMNGNTEEMMEEIQKRYPLRKIKVCPDPSGKARKTSAPVGQTDFTIIKSYKAEIFSPNRAPPVVDRINEVNALCLTANGVVRLFVSPKCVKLIKCLEGLTYKEKTSQPDKSLGLDHMTDALGYLIHILFPINKREMEVVKIIGF